MPLLLALSRVSLAPLVPSLVLLAPLVPWAEFFPPMRLGLLVCCLQEFRHLTSYHLGRLVCYLQKSFLLALLVYFLQVFSRLVRLV